MHAFFASIGDDNTDITLIRALVSGLRLLGGKKKKNEERHEYARAYRGARSGELARAQVRADPGAYVRTKLNEPPSSSQLPPTASLHSRATIHRGNNVRGRSGAGCNRRELVATSVTSVTSSSDKRMRENKKKKETLYKASEERNGKRFVRKINSKIPRPRKNVPARENELRSEKKIRNAERLRASRRERERRENANLSA